MNILSLPDEMLTIVLKHTKFGRLIKLRKMSTKIDALSRRNKLCERVSVDKFDYQDPFIWGQFVVRLYMDPDDDADLELNSPLILPATPELAPTFQQYLPLIEIQHEFTIGRIKLKNHDIAMLYEQRRSLRKVKKLMIHYTWTIDVNEKYARMLYDEVFPSITRLNIYRCNENQLIFNEKLLSNRKWKKIELNSSDLDVYRIDDFFRNVAINCEEIDFVSESAKFTIAGIVELLKNCITADGWFNRKFDLGLLFGNRRITIPDIYNIFNSIDFPGIRFTISTIEKHEWYNSNSKLSKITFEDRFDAPYLQFWLKENHPTIWLG